MNTAARADALAGVATEFPELCPPTARDLIECVRLELGHEEILDGFQPYGAHLSMALAPRTILHILSGNTPHAAFQTILRGVLLGSHNLVKFPSRGLGEIERFAEMLPAGLGSMIETARQLPENWVAMADALVVFGNDSTVSEFREKCPPGVIFQGHGHRISFGVVLDDPGRKSCAGAARDICLFEQQGCLSPQVIFVQDDAPGYAENLSHEIARFGATHPAPPLPLAERADVAGARAEWEFRASINPGVMVWKTAGEPGATVVLDDSAEFPVSPLNRFVFVKPLTAQFYEWACRHSRHLGGLGIWPCTPENASRFAPLGFSRICAIGRMQETPFTWHCDSRQNLASLVRWVDFEA